MQSPHYLGIGLSPRDVHVAHLAPDGPPKRAAVYLLSGLPGPDVVPRLVSPPGGGLLPVTLGNSRPLRAGELGWLEALLARLGRDWARRLAGVEIQAALAVPSATAPADRVKCREVARRAVGPGCAVVGANTALARALLGAGDAAATALLAETDHDGVTLSLLTGLKGAVRLRGQLRLRCLSLRCVEETILAALLSAVGKTAPRRGAIGRPWGLMRAASGGSWMSAPRRHCAGRGGLGPAPAWSGVGSAGGSLAAVRGGRDVVG